MHIKRYKINLLHLLSGNRYLPFSVKCPTIATIHDLRKFVIKNLYGYINSFYFKHILARCICKIDRILAVSHNTADDLNKFLEIDRSKIKVIHNACNDCFARKLDKSLLARMKSKYELNKPFILYVSRLEHPGKNHIALINAYTSLIKSNQIHHDLVLVGKNWNGAEKIIKTVKTNGIFKNVKILGFVPRKDLTAIYALADIFAFPSLAEGFGIPLLEAMASNTPVACSNINVFREIANKAAIYFDPASLKSISNALLALTNDPKLKKVLTIHGKKQLEKYSWNENAKATLLQYNKILLN